MNPSFWMVHPSSSSVLDTASYVLSVSSVEALAICLLSVIQSFLPKATSSPMVVYSATHTTVEVSAIYSMEVVLAIHATVAVLAIYRTEGVLAIDAMEEASLVVAVAYHQADQ